MKHARTPIAAAVAAATIVVSLVAASASAAVTPTLVAEVAVPDPTHLEFMTREIAGETRVFALQGSRHTTETPAGAPGGGLNVIDVTDPETPTFVLNVPCRLDNLDVAVAPVSLDINWGAIGVIRYDTLIALATNAEAGCRLRGPHGSTLAGGAVQLVGLRATPRPGETITADFLGRGVSSTYAKGGHTVVAHPQLPIFYVASQQTPDRTPTVEIVDARAWPPTKIVAPLPPTGVSPHDITFNPDGSRAYVSSVDLSFIWDTSGDKVTAPEVLTVIDAPNLKVHHEAVLHPNGRHLMITDETIASSGTLNNPVCPGGGISIFDLGPDQALERAPVLVGQFYAEELGAPQLENDLADRQINIACTAHEFNIVGDGRSMAMGWFAAGVRMLDLTALVDAAALPAPTPVRVTELGSFVAPGNDVWAAKQHPLLPGYVFVSDTALGFRVLKLASA